MESTSTQLIEATGSDLTNKINDLLIRQRRSRPSQKCISIGLTISEMIRLFHTKGIGYNFSAYEVASAILQSDPHAKYHHHTCSYDSEYVKAISRLNALAKSGRFSKEHLPEIKLVNPNMLVCSELPLEVAIEHDNVEMAKWLIDHGALLYSHSTPRSQIHKHIPDVTRPKSFKIGNINWDILSYIIEKGAYGHAKPMFLMLLRRYSCQPNAAVEGAIQQVLRNGSYYQWVAWLGWKRNHMIRGWLTRFNHPEKFMTNKLYKIFKQSVYIDSNTTSAFTLIKHMLKNRHYELVAQIVRLHNTQQTTGYERQADSAYEIQRHIVSIPATNAYCIARIVELNKVSELEAIKNSGFKLWDKEISELYAMKKDDYNALQTINKYYKIKTFTVEMYSPPLLSLIAEHYSDTINISSIISLGEELQRQPFWNIVAKNNIRNAMFREYQLQIVNVYL